MKVDKLMETVNKQFKSFATMKVIDPIGHRPIGVIAVGKTVDGVACRGVAICSSSQTFNQAEGETKALGRMVAAATRRKTCHPVVISDEVKAYRQLFNMAKTMPSVRLRTPTKFNGHVRGYSIARFQQRGYPFRFKSYFNARLTEEERKALKKIVKN